MQHSERGEEGVGQEWKESSFIGRERRVAGKCYLSQEGCNHPQVSTPYHAPFSLAEEGVLKERKNERGKEERGGRDREQRKNRERRQEKVKMRESK